MTGRHKGKSNLHNNLWLSLLLVGLAAVFAYAATMAVYVSGLEIQPVTVAFPPVVTTITRTTTIMPEDLENGLSTESYKVCERYANLDLSDMVKMCKMVGFQQ